MWPFVAAWFREMTVRVSFVGGLALAKKRLLSVLRATSEIFLRAQHHTALDDHLQVP